MGGVSAMSADNQVLAGELEEALAELPMLDAHTHLTGGKMAAQGLHDILLYHMVVSDLYAAGCPSGNRLTEYPGWPSLEEAHTRLRRSHTLSAADQEHELFLGHEAHSPRLVRLE